MLWFLGRCVNLSEIYDLSVDEIGAKSTTNSGRRGVRPEHGSLRSLEFRKFTVETAGDSWSEDKRNMMHKFAPKLFIIFSAPISTATRRHVRRYMQVMYVAINQWCFIDVYRKGGAYYCFHIIYFLRRYCWKVIGVLITPPLQYTHALT